MTEKSRIPGRVAATENRPSAAAVVSPCGDTEPTRPDGNPRFRLSVFPRFAAATPSDGVVAMTEEYKAVGRMLHSFARSLEEEEDLSWARSFPSAAETRAAMCLADVLVKAMIGEGRVGLFIAAIGMAAWAVLKRK